MRFKAAFLLALGLITFGCASKPTEREFPLHGQVLGISRDRTEATIKHDEIKGFMEAMTMPYKVRDAKELQGVAPGDVIDATLHVVSNDAYLTNVKKVGSAPLDPGQGQPHAASSGFELLKPGDHVPNTEFVDQDGKRRELNSFTGSAVALTFIYTRCPLPTFCPLMDRNFVTIQKAVKGDAALNGKVHLVTISFDPNTDTPEVLTRHARTLGADPAMWTFLTGNRDEIDQFAERFGMTISRDTADPLNITHTLRTAVLDPGGRLVKVYTGNEWTPEQVLGDLKAVADAN